MLVILTLGAWREKGSLGSLASHGELLPVRDPVSEEVSIPEDGTQVGLCLLDSTLMHTHMHTYTHTF